MRRPKLAENLTVAIVLGGASMYAVARMDTNETRTLPYQGTLEQNGGAANGEYLMRFGLFVAAPTANDLACVLEDNCALWSEEQLVSVVNGRFSVALGDSDADLTDTVLGNNTLYLAVAVKEAADPGAFTLLDGVQEIVPQPWAARAAAAKDFKITGDLEVQGAASVDGALVTTGFVGVGTSTPAVPLHVQNGSVRVVDADNTPNADIAQFFANNLMQGIGIASNRIEAVGLNPSQDLFLQPKGSGRTFQLATRNTDDVQATYWRSERRYLVEATVQAASPTYGYTTIPEAVLNELCGPPDGCTVRLGMRNWCGTQDCNTSTSMGPFTFWYGPNDGLNRHRWRRAESLTTNNPAQILEQVMGVDGDGATTHVVRDHNCYFTDAFYQEGTSTNSDAASAGMGLLNWNVGAGYLPVCWLVIDD